jgi:hypothetical protein
MKLTDDGFVNSPDESAGQGHRVYQRDAEMVFLSDYSGLWSVSVSSSERDNTKFYVTQPNSELPSELDSQGYRAQLLATEQLNDCLWQLLPWLSSRQVYFQPDTIHIVPIESGVAPISISMVWEGKALSLVTLGENSSVATSKPPVFIPAVKTSWGDYLGQATPTPSYLTGSADAALLQTIAPYGSQAVDSPYFGSSAVVSFLNYAPELHVLDGVFILELCEVHDYFHNELKFISLQPVDSITGAGQKVISTRHGHGETITISLAGVMRKASKDMWVAAIEAAGYARATCATRGHGTCAFTCFSITIKAKEFDQQ